MCNTGLDTHQVSENKIESLYYNALKNLIEVVYHPNIDETNIIEDFEELYIDVDTDETPLRSSFGLVKLDFEKAVQYIAPLDYRFESFFKESVKSLMKR